MTLEALLVLLIIGLIAGWLASAVVGGGFGIVGDMCIGVVGAFLGTWLFAQTNVSGTGGLAGRIFVAFVGAVILLLLLRLWNAIKARQAAPPK